MKDCTYGPVDNALFLLLRAGLYEDPAVLAAFPSLSGEDWERVRLHARRQTVSGIVCHALSMLPDDKLPPYPLLLEWVARTHRIESAFSRMSDAIASLIAVFNEAGIEPVLEKGHSVARFYSRPSLRVSGDIDLFMPADRKLSDSIITDRGIALRHAPDGSSSYLWDGFEVEHHRSLVRIYNPLRTKALAEILDREGLVRVSLRPGLDVRVMAPLPELLMYNVHILKHVLGSGIGLRQICDYAMAARVLIPVIGREKYVDACRSLGLARWTDTLHRFIETYLDHESLELPHFSREADTKAVRKLYSLIAGGGNFGQHDESSARTSAGAWSHKLTTFRSFIRHGSLSARVAPLEALGLILSLVKGQLHL